jgi:aryl-alcohol dehydrogenase-like predicted oxidoreductase
VRFRPLGRTGLSASVIGLGTWQLGGEWGIDFTQVAVDGILDTAADCGINFIDTAECYGDHLSEALIGDYLARHDRSRWIVATKFGHRFDGFLKRRDDFSVDGVRKQLDASLRALRVDTIDLYQFHSGPDAAFDNDDLWTMLHAERDAGRIRHLGVSLNKTTERQADWAAQRGLEVIQLVHNRLDQRAAKVHFPFAARDGLGVLARVPLASGLLSGKYHVGAQFPANDLRSRTRPETLQRELEEVERIHRDELPSGMSMAQWAIAWCLKEPLVSAVIPGCKSPEQVRGNAAAADLVLLD